MARVQLLLCFTFLFASVTFMELVSGGDSKESPKGDDTKSSGPSFEDTTGPGSNSGSPSESPASSPSASATSAGSRSRSSITSHSSSSTKSSSSSSSTTSSSLISQSSATTVAELEAETSKDVMAFIMNLEKKCPPKEEFKSFFEKLKSTMVASAKVSFEQKKGFFSAAAGKISDAMSFIGSRISGKSAEVKKSMEAYHQEVAKALQELEAIHKKIISENQGKADGSVKVSAEQRTEIKQTITRWETVTTQFVETAIQTEASSNTTVGIDKVKLT